jgi:hypothetical protein
MPRPSLTATLLVTSSFAFSAILFAQTSSIEGNIVGTDGRALKGAEIRFEHKGGQVSPVISHTDINGHYSAALPRGLYKMSLTAPRTPKTSITVKATGANSRIDFDLRPSAQKQITHYVWVGGDTGSHLPGRWVEAGIRAASPSPAP